MTIIWRDQLSVSNNLIDKEHKYLIEQLNAIEVAVNSKENHDILVETLAHLVDYTQTHFEHEEVIQQKIRYPELEKHKQEHKQIMLDLFDIKDQLDKILGIDHSEDDKGNEEEITDSELEMLLDDEPQSHSVDIDDLQPLVGLIRSWVVDHVIGSDLKLKPYLSKLPAEFQ